MKRKLLLASAMAVSSVGIAGTAFAATETGTTVRDEFATKLADKFNLNKNEVSTFLKEEHDARHAEMQAKVTSALKNAGFSDEQITALQNKKQEQRDVMETWRTANPDATKEERQTQRETEKTEFEAWAKEQNIDLEKVRTTLKDSGIGGHRGGGMRGENPRNDV